MKVYRWTFVLQNTGKRVEFGPYPTETEAMWAFQYRYGYWPEAAVNRLDYPTPPGDRNVIIERQSEAFDGLRNLTADLLMDD